MTWGNRWQRSVGTPSKKEARPVLLRRKDSSTSSSVGNSDQRGVARSRALWVCRQYCNKWTLSLAAPSSSSSKCCRQRWLIASSSVRSVPSSAVTFCSGLASLLFLLPMTPIHFIFCSTRDGGRCAACSATCWQYWFRSCLSLLLTSRPVCRSWSLSCRSSPAKTCPCPCLCPLHHCHRSIWVCALHHPNMNTARHFAMMTYSQPLGEIWCRKGPRGALPKFVPQPKLVATYWQ